MFFLLLLFFIKTTWLFKKINIRNVVGIICPSWLKKVNVSAKIWDSSGSDSSKPSLLIYLSIFKSKIMCIIEELKYVNTYLLLWISCLLSKGLRKDHSLIAALIESSWWKMLSLLCLYNKKKLVKLHLVNLLCVNEIIRHHLRIVDFYYV